MNVGYVGWWPSGSSVIVGHQGTDFAKMYVSVSALIQYNIVL